MNQTSILEGFSEVQAVQGVGQRKGILLKSGGSDELVIATFVPAEARSTEARLIWQAFENSAQLKHPAILTPIDVRRVQGGLTILTPHLEGPSARSIIDARLAGGRSLDLTTILRIARPLCGALHHGHDEARDVDDELLHIPHGWICPDTVRLTTDGQVVFADYWIGWVVARLARQVPTSYTSPQIARGEPPSAQGDIFALGSLLFELATLSPLIPDTDRGAIHTALRNATYRRRFDLLGHRDPGLAAIIRRCLAPAGAHRYPDIRALDGDLLRLSRGETPLALDGEAQTDPPKVEDLEFDPETLAPKAAPQASPSKGGEALKETDLGATLPSGAPKRPQDTQDLIETTLVTRDALSPGKSTQAPDARAGSYGVQETQEMPPEQAAAIAAEIQGEAQGAPKESQGREGAFDWFKGTGTGEEIVEAFNSPTPFDEAAAQHFAQSAEEAPSDLPEDFDEAVDFSARPPRLRRFLAMMVIAAVVALGGRYVLQTFNAPGDFRITRMEQVLGVEGQGSEEERLIVLEAMAGRQRIGDNLAFRAEHLESELGPVIQVAQGGLPPIEAYYGLGEAQAKLPINQRLGRLESLTFGEPRFRPAPGERPYSLRSRRDHLIEANRGRIALVGARVECPGEGPCEGGRWGAPLKKTVKSLSAKTKAQWSDDTHSAIPRIRAPSSIEGRLQGGAGEISAGDR